MSRNAVYIIIRIQKGVLAGVRGTYDKVMQLLTVELFLCRLREKFSVVEED